MKAFHGFFVLAFVLNISNANAQDITISSTDLVNLKNEIQQLKDSVAELNMIIAARESLIASKDSSFNELASQNEHLQSDLERMKMEKVEKDSLIDVLQVKEESYNSQMQTMQEALDRSSAKLANGRLYFRYSDNLVQSSIQSLLELKTEKVKKDFEQALKLLWDYKYYSEDVKSMFSQLQSIDENLRKSKHQAEEYKAKCLSILERSVYYQNVYIRKSPSSWSIPYLDNLLDAAKSIISKHNPVDSEYADFSPLIEML